MGDVTSQDILTVAIIAGMVAFGATPMGGVSYYWAAGFMAASFAAGKLLAPDPSSTVSNARGREVNVRSAIATRSLIYGTALIGGTVVYATSSGGKHEMLHQVIVLADQESEDILDVFFNEESAYSDTFHKKWFTSARVWIEGNKIRSGGDNPNLNNFGEQNRGIFLDYSNTSDPNHMTHGYYYGTRGLDTDVRDNHIKANKVTNLPMESHQFSTYYPDIYASWRKITKYYGTTTQTADPDLIRDDPTGAWDADCTLSGITYIVVSMLFDPDKYPSGIPNVTSIVKGKKVYDPREDPTIPGSEAGGTHDFYDSSTWTWSDNWCLCILDYLKCPTYGLNLSKDDFDWNSITTTATECYADVSISAESDETVKKYTMNGVVDTGASISDNIEAMLSAAEGRIAFTQGKYSIYAAVPGVPSGDLLDEKDLSSEMQIRASVPRTELFNVVGGIFIDETEHYTATDFPRYPAVTARNIYETEDGEEIKRDIELPFTTNVYQAQMLAKLVLETSRQNIVVTFGANIKALQYSLWQVVNVSIDSLGWDQKDFRITNIEIAATGQVNLTLREENDDMYLWNNGDVTLKDTSPNSGLPSPLYTVAPEINYPIDTSEIFRGVDGSIQSSIKIGWIDNSPYTSYYEIEFKKAVSLDEDIPWVGFGTSSKALVSISPVSTGDFYYVKVRSVSNIGVRSQWAISDRIRIEGELAPPSAVQSFRVRVQSDGTREYIWEHTSKEIDVTGYIIKYIPQNDLPEPYDLQTIWDDGSMALLFDGEITQSPFELNSPPSGDYLFAIVAIDASGTESTPVRYIVSLPDPRTKNSIYSSDEALRGTGFIGEKIDCNTLNRDLFPAIDGNSSWFATWDAADVWHAGNVVTSFTYWTGNSDLTVSDNSKINAINLGTTITVTPNMNINTTGIAANPTVTWYYLNDEETGAVWENTTTETNIRARWIKAKVVFTVTDGKTAFVNEMSIELTGDLVQETLEGIVMADLRALSDFDYLFPDASNGHMYLPITRPFKVITHVSISAIAAGAATSYDILDKDISTNPGPEIQLWRWAGSTFSGWDGKFDAYIRGI